MWMLIVNSGIDVSPLIEQEKLIPGINDLFALWAFE